jgi:hypothetical protein
MYNAGAQGQYPQGWQYNYGAPPQSPISSAQPNRKSGLFNKLAHGLEKVATGIERAAKSEFVTNVKQDYRRGLESYEAQRAAVQQQREAEQATLSGGYQQSYEYESVRPATPVTAAIPVTASPTPEPYTQPTGPLDPTTLYGDIPRVNGSQIYDPQTLALAQIARFAKLKERFEQLKSQGYTDEQLKPLSDEAMATHELWKQANAFQNQYIMAMATRPMVGYGGGYGGAMMAMQNQMHVGNMNAIENLNVNGPSRVWYTGNSW